MLLRQFHRGRLALEYQEAGARLAIRELIFRRTDQRVLRDSNDLRRRLRLAERKF